MSEHVNHRLRTFRPSWLPTRLPPPPPPPPAPTEPTPSETNTRARRKFYASKAWLDVRAVKLGLNPICEDCFSRGVTTEARAVHHVLPIETHPDERLDVGNLQSLCLACHNRRHDRHRRTP